MQFAAMGAGHRQLVHLGQSGEVIEVRIQRLRLVDERDDSRLNEKPLYEFRRSVEGRGYCFAPPVKVDRSANMKVSEEMRTAPNGPSFTDSRAGLENVVLVLCIVYDVVEELLRESWRHGGAES